MNNFVYQMPVKVCFGENCVENHLASELSKVGPNILLAYGKGSVKKNGIYDQIVSVLKSCGKNIVELTDIPANPTYDKVCEGIRLYKEHRIDLVLAVGGGSVVDCCKVIAAGACVEEDIWELEMNQHITPAQMGSFAVVLTLSGAGAEMDCLGAITKEETHEKKTFVGPYAKFVLLDPTYLMGIPLPRFLPGVFDSLSHCMETYFGNGTNVSDAMNEALMKDIVGNMRALISGEDTLEIRSNLMWDSSLIQTFLFNIGKPGDFQAHGIENALGAYSHGTHGGQLAVLQPRYYRLISKYASKQFARFARAVMDVDCTDDVQAAQLGLDALESLICDAGLKTTFSELGYDLTEEIARTVSQTCPINGGGLHILTREDVFQLLMACR